MGDITEPRGDVQDDGGGVTEDRGVGRKGEPQRGGGRQSEPQANRVHTPPNGCFQGVLGRAGHLFTRNLEIDSFPAKYQANGCFQGAGDFRACATQRNGSLLSMTARVGRRGGGRGRVSLRRGECTNPAVPTPRRLDEGSLPTDTGRGARVCTRRFRLLGGV